MHDRGIQELCCEIEPLLAVSGGAANTEAPAFPIHSHVWLGVGAPDQLQHEWYRSAPFLVSEPDPSHGEEEGSGHVPTIELSSRNAIIMCGN